MHPKQTPSHLDSNKEKKIVRLFFQGGRAGGSSVSILEKPIEKNKLVTTITLVAAVGWFVGKKIFLCLHISKFNKIIGPYY